MNGAMSVDAMGPHRPWEVLQCRLCKSVVAIPGSYNS